MRVSQEHHFVANVLPGRPRKMQLLQSLVKAANLAILLLKKALQSAKQVLQVRFLPEKARHYVKSAKREHSAKNPVMHVINVLQIQSARQDLQSVIIANWSFIF